jgi:hypothetical protein
VRVGYLWLLSLLVYPVVGAPLLKARAFRVFGLASRGVLSAGVGLALVSWTMTAFAFLRLRWGPLVLLVAAMVALLLRLILKDEDPAVLLSPHTGGGQGGGGRSSRAITLIAHALTLLALLSVLAATAAARSTSPDLLLFWGPKAQQFALARTVDAEFLSTPFLEYLHVYYPPLVPNVLAFPAIIAGRFPWGAVTLTFPVLLAATAIGLFGILRTGSDRGSAAATTALATSAIGLLGIRASVAGNAEPFLLLFETLSAALLLSPVAATTGGLLLAGLLLAGAAASKVEGLPFLAAVVALFLVFERRRLAGVGKTLLLLVGPAAVSLGTWFGFGAAHKLFYGYQSYGRFLDLHWDHFDQVLSGFGLAFWKSGYALPFLIPLLALLLTPPKSRRALIPIGVAVLLAGFFTFTYLHYQADPRLWISWSAARVFSPLPPLFALAAWCSHDRRGISPPP